MIHYDTLFHTISHCDTPALCDTPSTETEHCRFCPASKPPLPPRCHYLAPPLPSLVVLVAPLPPHSTGCSVHLEGVMQPTSVERQVGWLGLRNATIKQQKAAAAAAAAAAEVAAAAQRRRQQRRK